MTQTLQALASAKRLSLAHLDGGKKKKKNVCVCVCVGRALLCNLVRVKLGCYEAEGQNSPSPEDYLKAFMETEVKPLWPKGWMQARLVCMCDALIYRTAPSSICCSFEVQCIVSSSTVRCFSY